MRLELPKWYDLHIHLRQDEMLAPLISDVLKMGCAGVLAMPNTKPPTAKVFKSDDLPYWSIEEYREMIMAAGGDKFDVLITPLYLTQDTSAKMIEEGAKAGLIQACKYYPPYGTTGAEFGYPFKQFVENGVFEAMRDNNVTLCIHGEEHGLSPEEYFNREQNAEELFYKENVPLAIDKFDGLKIVGEHMTTKVAVDLVKSAPDTVGATITPQHLMFTIGHLLQGLKYHLYCLPLVKFEEDREALRQAVFDPNNTKFFAGTDSAPHTCKATDCGCAAGCYTGGIAPQVYAQGFETAGVDLTPPPVISAASGAGLNGGDPQSEPQSGSHIDSVRGSASGEARQRNDDVGAGYKAFKNFLCLNGAKFYGLKVPEETFILEKSEAAIAPLAIGDQEVTPLPLGMSGQTSINWKIV